MAVVFEMLKEQYTVDEGQVTGGRYALEIQVLVNSVPVLSGAITGDEDLSFVDWFSTVVPLEIVEEPIVDPEIDGDWWDEIDLFLRSE